MVAAVVDDVVGADWRQRLSVDAEGAALEFDDVLLEDDVGGGGNAAAEAQIVEAISEVLLHLIHRLSKLLGDSLT